MDVDTEEDSEEEGRRVREEIGCGEGEDMDDGIAWHGWLATLSWGT